MSEIETRRFGRYRVVETLGRGAMGEVYAAVDDVLGREVAIKTLRGTGGDGARLLDERFRNEARAIASLAHPGVVQVFDVDVAATPPFLVMERVAGPSLSTRLEAGALSLAEVRTLGVQIARALAAAHARGIIHRDVKPGNILGAGPGMWKLADFGVAHVPDSTLTLTGQFVGSLAYAAPEALTKGELEPACDIYGLGAVLYEAATGRWPRSEKSSPGVAALLAPPPSLAELAPHVPADLAAAIERAIAVRPADRPTADELARALAGELTLDPRAPRPVTPAPSRIGEPPAASAWRRRAPWIGAAAALLLGIAIGVGQRGGGAASAPTPPIPTLTPPAREITVHTPRGLAGKADKEWSKIVDKIYDGDYGEARRKLAEFERRYGRTIESYDLAVQLDRRAGD